MKVKLHLIFFMVVKFSLSLKIEGKMKQIKQEENKIKIKRKQFDEIDYSKQKCKLKNNLNFL